MTVLEKFYNIVKIWQIDKMWQIDEICEIDKIDKIWQNLKIFKINFNNMTKCDEIKKISQNCNFDKLLRG